MTNEIVVEEVATSLDGAPIFIGRGKVSVGDKLYLHPVGSPTQIIDDAAFITSLLQSRDDRIEQLEAENVALQDQVKVLRDALEVTYQQLRLTNINLNKRMSGSIQHLQARENMDALGKANKALAATEKGE